MTSTSSKWIKIASFTENENSEKGFEEISLSLILTWIKDIKFTDFPMHY